MKRVLIVDDVKDTQCFLATILMSDGHQTYIARDGKEAVKLAREHKPHLIILDVMLPDVRGTALIPLFMKIDESVIIIMLTAYGSLDDALATGKAGVSEYLEKSTNLKLLFPVIYRYLKHEEIDDNTSVSGPSDYGSESISRSLPKHNAVVEQLKLATTYDALDRVKMAIAAAGGNKSKAAQLLGISRMTLHRRLKTPPKGVNPQNKV